MKRWGCYFTEGKQSDLLISTSVWALRGVKNDIILEVTQKSPACRQLFSKDVKVLGDSKNMHEYIYVYFFTRRSGVSLGSTGAS